jgi:hypothetical protein
MKIQTMVTGHKGWTYKQVCIFIPCVASLLFVFSSLVLRHYCLYFHPLCCVTIVCIFIPCVASPIKSCLFYILLGELMLMMNLPRGSRVKLSEFWNLKNVSCGDMTNVCIFFACVASLLFVFSSLVLRNHCLYFCLLCYVSIACIFSRCVVSPLFVISSLVLRLYCL